MKILVLSPWGIGGSYSGPAEFVNRLFGEVSRRGHSVSIIYGSDGREAVPDWVDKHWPVTFSHSGERPGRRAQLTWIAETRRTLRREAGQFDLIHLHGAFATNCLAAFGHHKTPLAILPLMEGADLRSGRGGLVRLYERARRSVLQDARAGFALSAGISDELVEAGVPAHAVVRLANAVDTAVYCPSELTGTKDQIRIGFVGKLGKIKQPHLLLDVIRILKKQGISAQGIFVGPYDTPDYERLFKNKAEELDLNNQVRVTGYIRDVATEFKNMDVFVLPSIAEGMPGALVEAMASGVPSLVTDVGSMKHLIDESGAGSVIPPNPPVIAAALRDLILTPGARRRASEAARSFAVKNFSLESVAETYIDAVSGTGEV